MAHPPVKPDLEDVQGLLRFGFGHLPGAAFLMLTIDDAAKARSWLGAVRATSAVGGSPRPERALQVALSADGLRALGVAPDVIAQFAPEFVAGLAADPARARRLGDVGPNAPATWTWGGPGRVPHVLVLLYAAADRIGPWTEETLAELSRSGFRLLLRLAASDFGGREPFGFKDGISQPVPDWDGVRTPQEEELEYGNVLALGEFVLGYPNEYGCYTNRPLVTRAEGLPKAADRPDRFDVARNGTYLVMRQLEQDVPAFWRFLDRATGGRAEERVRLAEAMVGRKMSGEPLAARSTRAVSGTRKDADDAALNDFTFDDDASGARCPLGAHIRRANPRNSDFPAGTEGNLGKLLRTAGIGSSSPRDDLVASTRFHRVLRRGRAYGTQISMEEALERPEGGADERGIHFIALNANIARQFEFVQGAWLSSAKFDGLGEENDPLTGGRDASGAGRFSEQRSGGLRKVTTGIPRFVTVRGGAYFFLPGIRALRWLALGG